MGLLKDFTQERGYAIWKEKEYQSSYIGPYKILSKFGKVAYALDLPIELVVVHHVFHVFLLKKFIRNSSLVVTLNSFGIEIAFHMKRF